MGREIRRPFEDVGIELTFLPRAGRLEHGDEDAVSSGRGENVERT